MSKSPHLQPELSKLYQRHQFTKFLGRGLTSLVWPLRNVPCRYLHICVYTDVDMQDEKEKPEPLKLSWQSTRSVGGRLRVLFPLGAMLCCAQMYTYIYIYINIDIHICVYICLCIYIYIYT